MGYNERTIGGGPAKGLAADFTKFLSGLINTGSFGGGTAGQQFGGANPGGDAAGIFGLLNSIVSNPEADASVQDLINKDIERGRNDLRSRFGASGGMSFGTPAAFAESLYQSEQAPRTAIAMDQMAQNRLASLMPFFQFANQLSSMGIPQAQSTLEPSGGMQAFNIASQIANTASNFIPGGGGGASAPGLNMPSFTPGPVNIPIPNIPTTGAVSGRSPGLGFNFTPLPGIHGRPNQNQQYY